MIFNEVSEASNELELFASFRPLTGIMIFNVSYVNECNVEER